MEVSFECSSCNEQQLTCYAGGWQDQVGGQYPGLKFSVSPPKLPIKVQVASQTPSQSFMEALEARLVLVQTGPARLARDLLQNVIRRWHRREPSFIDLIQDLRTNASAMNQAILNEEFPQVAAQLDKYWQLKKSVVGPAQAEPSFVTELLDFVKPHTVAASLCGAGGGGFAVLLLTEETSKSEFRSNIETRFGMTTYAPWVCHKGLQVQQSDT